MITHRHRRRTGVLTLLLSLCTGLALSLTLGTSVWAAPAYPFPQHIVYATGTLRPNHRTQMQQDGDVRAYYDQWKANFLVSAGMTMGGTPLYRIAFGDPNFTVSEGQGFGMLIVAFMAGYDANAQTFFDGLWRFTRAHPSQCGEPRLMAFKVPENDDGLCSAFDGDADMAYALLLADKQWGSGDAINYHAEALNLIDAVGDATIGPVSRLPMFGDWVDPDGRKYNQYTTRSSDFMLDHFRAFRRVTGDPVWDQVVLATQAAITRIQTKYSPATGLLPDFLMPLSLKNHTLKPARPRLLEGPFDGRYSYNAVRDPWRLGTDALLSNDATTLAQVRRISLWAQSATGGNPQNIRAGYALDGKPLPGSNFFTIVFAAPLGVAAMTEPTQQAWLNALYGAVSTIHEGYYQDSVTLLCLLVMTGNYWDPTTVGP